MGITHCTSHGRQELRLVCEHVATRGPGSKLMAEAALVYDNEFPELQGWLCPSCKTLYAKTPLTDIPFVPVCQACYPERGPPTPARES
jgi:hypothetical protein